VLDFAIDDYTKIKNKLLILTLLENIKIATDLMKGISSNEEDDVIGCYYKRLKCNIQLVDKNVISLSFFFKHLLVRNV